MSHVGKPKATMQQLCATPPRRHSRHKENVSKDLAHCTHVFMRHDAIQTPLQPPYDEPYKVMQPGDKNFTIMVNGKEKVVSLDQLKPAHVEDSSTGHYAHRRFHGAPLTTYYISYPSDKDH